MKVEADRVGPTLRRALLDRLAEGQLPLGPSPSPSTSSTASCAPSRSWSRRTRVAPPARPTSICGRFAFDSEWRLERKRANDKIDEKAALPAASHPVPRPGRGAVGARCAHRHRSDGARADRAQDGARPRRAGAAAPGRRGAPPQRTGASARSNRRTCGRRPVRPRPTRRCCRRHLAARNARLITCSPRATDPVSLAGGWT